MNKTYPGIFCPACKMKNEHGAIICAYCNTPLGQNDQKTVMLQRSLEDTGVLPDDLESAFKAPHYTPERFMDFEIPSKGMILIHLETSQPLAVLDENAFILGRASDEIKTREPLVDLTNFGAHDYGISRVHALIRKTKKGYQITDLGSTNGTWIENQRLIPQAPTLLENGNRIRLGHLHILVFYLS